MRKFAARLAGMAAIVVSFAVMLSALAAPVAATPAQGGPRLDGCSGPAVRPSDFNPVCNDGEGTVIHLRWSSWGTSASGVGEFYSHRCVPDCALGAITLYPVDVSAWRVQDGVFTRFEYRFTGRVPNGLPHEWLLSFYSGLWHGRIV
jgi:hypothetical protein